MSKTKRAFRKNKGLVDGAGAVRYSLPQRAGGPIQIQIDFGKVPPPPQYVYADAVWVDVDQPLRMAVLHFGHRAHSGFADRVDVVMPEAALFNGFWNSTREVEKVVDQVLAQAGAQPPAAIPKFEGDPVATLYGNIIHIAVAPGDTSLDFYCLSPRDIHLARTQRAELTLQPIVRILMSTLLAKSFFDVLRPHATRPKASNSEGRVARATAVR